LAPGTMSSAESDMYIQNQRKLAYAGADVHVTVDTELELMAGIPVTTGPRIVLAPSFGISQQEIMRKVQGPVGISNRSSLVLDGHHLTLKDLQLDGALVIRVAPDAHVTVDGLKVQNKGWERQELDPSKVYPEHVRIRGYTMTRLETAEYIVSEPGYFVIDATGELTKVEQ
jgi:UDP-sugar pyrophosphorylase